MAELAIEGGAPVVASGDLGPGWPIHGPEERQQLREVLEADVWGATALGRKVEELNRLWASYCGTRRSVALSNGTATIELALRALGVGPGDEVIVPAWTFMATAAAVLQIGASPVFVDVEAGSLCMDADALEAALSPRVKAVVPVHFAGHPCDMDRISTLASRYGLAVVEDAAQAHGAIWRGRSVGALGSCGSFSFQQYKNLQCGEGGSVTTDDEELADRLHYSLSKFGRGVRDRYAPFTHYELAGNETMTEFQAAVALAQLGRLDGQTARRNVSRRALQQWLEEIEGIDCLIDDPRVDRHGCHLFVFRYDAGAFSSLSRDEFVSALQAEGVPCSALYPRPLFEEPMYDLDRLAVRGCGTSIRVTDCPETRRAAANVVAVPHYVLLADLSQLRAVSRSIGKIQAGAVKLAAATARR